MIDSSTIIHFPIDTGDQAKIHDPRSLLAREVYVRIEEHLLAAVDKAERIERERGHCLSSDRSADHSSIETEIFDRFRSHEAILLDGGRGTGKSSVLVNLQLHLRSNPRLAEQLLILKPVDPTLLENGDDLFLNVIVAALMRNRDVRASLKSNRPGSSDFYNELQELGSALEGIQKIGEEFGLDKLRAFVENQELAQHVHNLFYSALRLTNKKLIVLPIDDVDTSLELAFENIEVVRKYLTSPCVLPLISGELHLYDDVIYRKFAQRLVNVGRFEQSAALRQARNLAEEYSRKVLPLPRRIRLPVLTSYLDNPNIHLVDGERTLISLPLFKNWLEALLNERVNGEENSFREVPLRTVREFAQFVQSTRHLLPDLLKFFNDNGSPPDGSESATKTRRKLFMSPVVADAVDTFAQEFEAAFAIRRDETRTQRTAREGAYRRLRESVGKARTTPDPNISSLLVAWNHALGTYAYHQRNWGSTYLVSNANVHLQTASTGALAHDLFRPQRHGAAEYRHFDETQEFGQMWADLLAEKAPEQWLARLPKTTLLSYPAPETGAPVQRAASQDLDNLFPVRLARRLLVHWSYYSRTDRRDLMLCGRMFELLVASLTHDLDRAEVMRILHQPPFYSLAAFARTKTLNVDANPAETDKTQDEPDWFGDHALEDDEFDAELFALIERINAWRGTVQIARPSAWFIFVIMNKFFSQVSYINPNGGKPASTRDLVRLFAQTFNLFWSAVGSFEKGQVFGLPHIVATVNMSKNSLNFDKHPLYMQNIAPFLQLPGNAGYADFGTGSYTYALESHPLRRLWNDLDSDIVESESDDVDLPPEVDTLLVDKRIDRYVNEVRRNLKMNLSAEAIEAAPDAWLMRVLEEVQKRCARDPATLARFQSLPDLLDLPKNSGRRRLQRIMKKLYG